MKRLTVDFISYLRLPAPLAQTEDTNIDTKPWKVDKLLWLDIGMTHYFILRGDSGKSLIIDYRVFCKYERQLVLKFKLSFRTVVLFWNEIRSLSLPWQLYKQR